MTHKKYRNKNKQKKVERIDYKFNILVEFLLQQQVE